MTTQRSGFRHGLILHIFLYVSNALLSIFVAFLPLSFNHSGNRCSGAIPDLFWTPCWRRLLRRICQKRWFENASCEFVLLCCLGSDSAKRRNQMKVSWSEISWDPIEPSKVSKNNLNQVSSDNHASSNVYLKLIYEICLCMAWYGMDWYGMESNAMQCNSIESNAMWCNVMQCNLT